MQKIKREDLIEKGFEIEDNIFVYSGLCSDTQSNFVRNIIEKELNKPFYTISTEPTLFNAMNLNSKSDSKFIVKSILKLNITERLYSVMGLLENYVLEGNDNISKTVGKALESKKLNKYRNLIKAINSLDDDYYTNKQQTKFLKKIKKFEKKNNITILIEY